MKCTLDVVLACLLFFCAQAQPGNRSSKCKCLNGFIGRFNPQLIQADPVVYQPTVFCPNTEITVIIANKEKCVNPQSRVGKLILTNKQRQVTPRPVTTTASTQSYTAQHATRRPSCRTCTKENI